ncbi:precorrin-3B synthase [Phreatobacter stygius]|uniref:Precorrin-3B synthase n=1 Tax=Phreatobacter stygius TaxID=1940610 RepID=A0A4D7B5J8_9HYPH|nr:precorrin-3B synthase [Phreatobacter stygius]QCI68291.1 precorrin-3B synthase [Phreatobacter stygius]
MDDPAEFGRGLARSCRRRGDTMNPAVRSALRRGWCPGALRPMATGDGLLVRLHPPGGRFSAADLSLVARLARDTGNGLVDLTGRGNLQIRGVRPESHGDLVAGLIDGALVDPDEDVGPYRLTLVSPLAGRDPTDLIDAAALAGRIERLRREIGGLPAKTSVIVDGGGALSLDRQAGDLRLMAISSTHGVIGLPDGSWFGPAAVEVLPGVTELLLGRLAERHRAEPELVRRMRDLARDELAGLVAPLGFGRTTAPPGRPRPPEAGIVSEPGGTSAILFGAAFGRCTADQFDGLAAIAEAAGAEDFRLSPWRGFAMTGLAGPDLALAEVAKLGLIVAPDDPRLGVRACPGAPACSRGEVAAQSDAAMFARAASARLAGGMTLHVSGCPKGCAHPGIADVTLVGHDGAYHIVLGGTAAGRPMARLTAANITSALAGTGDIGPNLQGVSSS